MLRNPFGVRAGQILVVSDLSPQERGLKCGCACPHCGGDLLARMGEKKIHHFSHTKDACDETAAFVAGLFQLFLQMINETGSFHAPALIVTYHLPRAGMTETNVGNYIRIVPERKKDKLHNTIVVAKGKLFAVEAVSLACNTKKQPEALLISAKGRQLAIRVLPPPNCKVIMPKPYSGLPTLLFDAGDIDFHILSSDRIRLELLDSVRWSWLSNPRSADVHDRIYAEYLQEQEHIRKSREQQKQTLEQRLPKQSTPLPVSVLGRKEREQAGYLQIKGRFTGQDEMIRDSFGTRWVQCEVCSQIKPDYQFSFYGGIGRVNLGVCALCSRRQAGKP